MTMDDLRRDREVGTWIRAEAPTDAPARLRETIRSELAQTRQESGPVLLMHRGMLLSPARAVLAAAVILGFGVVAGGFLGIRGNTGEVTGPSPTSSPVSTPSASASPTATPTPVPTVSGLALPPGQTTTGALTPAMQFTVPAGWLKTDDRRLAYRISPVDAGYGVQGDESVVFDGVGVFVGPLAGPPDGTIGPVEGVGTTSADLAAWLSTRPQLTATQPIQTTLAGRPAYQLDFDLSPAAGDLCNIQCANLLDAPDGGGSYRFGIEGPWKVRAYLLEAPDGTTIMVAVDDVDGQGFDQEVLAAQPIIDSMTFAP